jgi:hypothetical protein
MVQTHAQYAYVYKCVFEYLRKKEERRNKDTSASPASLQTEKRSKEANGTTVTSIQNSYAPSPF